jgi:hypothetical protein
MRWPRFGQDPIDKLTTKVSDIDHRLVEMQDQLSMLRPALAGLAGLDNVTAGIADLVGVLSPLHSMALRPQLPRREVVDAIGRIQAAAATETEWISSIAVPNAQIPFIGEAPAPARVAAPAVAPAAVPAPASISVPPAAPIAQAPWPGTSTGGAP